ncbi:cyclase family protein [Methanobacterium alcaliphilum]|uniref:cyclase family protein n=1 Tax=Methanobacterium alcaliphilum TaxID=392018 RepID=UPI002009E02A|nr:cyclase family protein [Methanobacterium alcaliphilum]MCK9151186.1 cyclase family protein [Methanobacterium alcaliphilum]
MQYTYLSYNIHEKSLVYKGLKEPKITHQNTIGTEGYNTYMLSIENHSGTHIDAPAHFLDDGKTISEYEASDFIFNNVLLLKSPQDPKGTIGLEELDGWDLSEKDCLLISTGFSNYRDSNPEKYLTQSPGISPDLIHHIRKKYPSIRCIGIDCVSISSYGDEKTAVKAHKTAFVKKEGYGDPLFLIEDMKLDGILPEKRIKKLMVFPWQIEGVDSAPATVIAQLE